MEKFTRLTATACPLDVAKLNTDQIVPARFLAAARPALGEAAARSAFRCGRA
jgi:3-isopropylmalate dehydratase small subunit